MSDTALLGQKELDKLRGELDWLAGIAGLTEPLAQLHASTKWKSGGRELYCHITDRETAAVRTFDSVGIRVGRNFYGALHVADGAMTHGMFSK